MKRFLLVLILPLLLLSQGCMTVTMRMSGPQSGCMNEVKYTGGDSFMYDPVISKLMEKDNSVLETAMKEYPDSYRYFLSSRQSLRDAELKKLIGSITQGTGSLTAFISALNWRSEYSGGFIIAGLSMVATGLVINLFSMADTADSVKKLAKAIDKYNAHCY